MSVNYQQSLINSRLTLVLNQIDGAPTNGNLRLLDTNNNTLALIGLSRPSGVVASGVYSFSGLPLLTPSAVNSGLATSARVEDGNGAVVISGLIVNGSNPDIILSPNANITAGQTIAITSAQITGS